MIILWAYWLKKKTLKLILPFFSPTFPKWPLENLHYMSDSHYIFIGWCCFSLFPPDTPVPSLPIGFTNSSSPHTVFAHAISNPSILCLVNLYLSFSSLSKPLFLKENISDLHVLVQFSSYLLSHHCGPHRCNPGRSGNFTLHLIRYPLATTPN